jgi:uncharacterized protein (TIRG00374 family)
MSGLIMSITPGKMGELLKSFLLKEISGTPVSRSAPVVFIERITDFLSLIILTLIGAFIFDFGISVTISAGVFFLILIIIISNRKMAMAVIGLFERIKFFRKHLISIHNAYESSYILLKPVPLLKMIALSIAGWFLECFGYHLILINFDIDVNLLWASFNYAFATIIGSLTMLPGGLGATEGSLTLLVIDKGFPKEAAVASTFVARIVTLWFAVLVGILGVMIYQKRFGKIAFVNFSNQQNGDLNAEI